MTMNHVEASLVLPELPALLRPDLPQRARTRSSRSSASRPTTTGMVDEWCGGSGGRLIPLCLVPLWDAELAAAEVRRNAARGVRAVAFSELPAVARPAEHPLRLLGPVLRRLRGDRHRASRCTSARAPRRSTSSRRRARRGAGRRTSSPTAPLSLIDFLFSGVLVRYPDLKLLYAEAQIGWIPYVLERVDDVWETHRGWSDSQSHVPEPPSQLLLPPGRQLLLQGRRRHREPRPRRPRQHRVRDRLPAPGRHLAQHAPGRQAAVRRTSTRRRCTKIVRGNAIRLPRPRGPRRRQRSACRRDHARRRERRRVWSRTRAAGPTRADAGRARRARRPGRDRRRQPGRGRPARRRLRTASHLMALYHRPRRAAGTSAPTPRSRRSTTAAPPSASTAASASGRSPASPRSTSRSSGPREHGVATVAVRELTHLGALAYYTMRAAGAGLLRHGVPERRHHRPAVRRHHRAVLDQPVLVRGARRHEHPDVVYDIATTAAAGNKILLARKRGDASIPEGWANDEHGYPTTDPQAASISSCSGSAATRASASAMLVEIMAGVLADSSFGTTEHSESELTGWDRIAKGAELRRPRRLALPAPSTSSARTSTGSSTTSTRRRWRPAPSASSFPASSRPSAVRNGSRDGIPLSRGLVDELDRVAEQLGCPPLPTDP